MLKVNRAFLIDFAQLAGRYEWSQEDIEEVKQATRDNPGLVEYWKILAKAHRNGYEQTKQNGFIRLESWLIQNGFNSELNRLYQIKEARLAAEAHGYRK